MSDIADFITFNKLCMVFEETSSAKNKNKPHALHEFIKQCKEKCQELKQTNQDARVSFYPILRLILPQLERERGPYGIREVTFGKRLIKILGLPPEGDDAIRLLNYKAPSNNTSGDFSVVACEVLRKYCFTSPVLSIAEINSYLDTIAKFNSENNSREVNDTIHILFQNTSPIEQKWLIRIILKDLKLGLGQDRILNMYHLDGAELFSSNNSLLNVCDILNNSSIRLHEIEISMFSPFRPMLSQRCGGAQLNKFFSNFEKMYVETKFDGERFQLHMDNGEFKYFSRNGFDYTNTYGENFCSGLYTPLLKNVFQPHVKKVILDGEMMGWNKITNKFGSKGMNFDVKHLKTSSTHQPCFCVFDILLLNDQILTNKILQERSLILDSIINPKEGIIMISHHIDVTTKEAIVNCLNNSVDREEEGIVFKDPLSLYKSNNRNAGWWKMKLEYFENVMNDLDVIIMGGYYGKGKRSNRITGFLVGVAASLDVNTNLPENYLSIAKIASGLNDDELKIIEENLGPHWTKVDESNPENHGLLWGKEKPDVWISPNRSCILLVRATELVRLFSKDFKTDYTLRFPRIQKIRLDKPYYECLTLVEFQELTSSSNVVQKLNKRHLELSDLEIQKEPKVKMRYTSHETEHEVKTISYILKDREFCVLTGTKHWTKEDVENDIRIHSGTVVRNEGPDTFCILVGDDHPRVKSCQTSRASIDLVKLDWLCRVLRSGKFLLYTPSDTLHSSLTLENHFSNFYDKFGDSFTVETDTESFSQLMDKVKKTIDIENLHKGDYTKLSKAQTRGLLRLMSDPDVPRAFGDYSL